MITDAYKIVQPRFPGKPAIAIAMECYAKWQGCSFKKDLADYLANGYVVSRPTCFGMAKVIDLGKDGRHELAWFIRMVVGDLLEVIETLPFELPKVAFCRRNDGRVRVYSTARCVQIAIKAKEELNRRGAKK